MCNRWTWLPAPTQAGQVGGHEGVGTIAAFGPGAEDVGLKLGQRVGIKWLASVCGNCLACLSGRDACCPSAKISGFYTPGTFQQYALGERIHELMSLFRPRLHVRVLRDSC